MYNKIKGTKILTQRHHNSATVQTLAELIDLGESNHKAYYYPKGLVVFVVQNKKSYIWEDSLDIEADTPSLIENGFTYPEGVISDGIDYSNKTYNFYESSQDTNYSNPLPMSIAVGGYEIGTTFENKSNEEMWNGLLYPTINPDLVPPTFTLSLSNTGLKEVGSTYNATLAGLFYRGQIKGLLVAGVWNEETFQNHRAGIRVNMTLDTTLLVDPATTKAVTRVLELGANVFTGNVEYAEGPQPLNSIGGNFSTPLPAGTISNSTIITAIYPYFVYKSASPITATIMKAAIEAGNATLVLSSHTGTIAAPYAPDGEHYCIAYPASSTTKTKWYVTALSNGDIPGTVFGTVEVLNISSPTGLWSNVPYKIHSTPAITNPSAPIVELRNS